MAMAVQYFYRSKANQMLLYVLIIVTYAQIMKFYGERLWLILQQQLYRPETTVLSCCTLSIYWLVSGFFAIVDLKEWPSALYQRKLQRDHHVHFRAYISTAIFVLVQQILLVYPVMMLFCEYWMPLRARIVSFKLGGLQTWNIFLSMALFTVTEEVLFFSMHYAFHHPRPYKWVHKIHHSFTAPVGVAAMYAHPLENLLVNVIPLTIGPLVLGSHPFVYTFWMCFAAFNSVYTHSGYDIPGLPMGNLHDYHHMQFGENYGVVGIMDTLLGTNKKFLKIYKT